jgi:hypothetical protein
MMRKFFLIVTACLMACLTQNLKAEEFVFDLSQVTVPQNSNQIQLTQKTAAGKTVYFQITANSEDEIRKCYVDPETGRLAVPAGITLKFQCTEKLNEVWLGTVPAVDGSNEDIYFGNEVNSILDYVGINGTDNVFIAGRSNQFNAGTGTFSIMDLRAYNGDKKMYFIGPNVMVRTETISTEDLTFADHNVVGQYHSLSDELVGVDVVEVGPSWNKVSYLICRSADPISDVHKHKQGSQELLKDANGNTPAYADPTTVQYSWIGLKIQNPKDYVGMQFKGVRGQFVPDGNTGTDEYYNYRMFNPIMQVVGTPTIVAENVETVLNDYTVANLEEQDDKRFFFMEPRPFELCNVKDVMRTNAQGIKTPSKAAIMPDSKTENIYVDNGISGFAAIIDPQYDTWKDSDMELFKVNTEWEAQALAWRCENKIYDIPKALVFFATFDKNENPLDIPNRDYYQWANNKDLGIHIQGKAKIREYDEDMVVGDGDHWSRYEYGTNRNAYRNDLEITIYNPATDFSHIGDMSIIRCDNEGNELVKIASLKQNKYDNTKFEVTYFDETQDAKDDVELAKIKKAKYVAGEFDVKTSAIGVSDMFYSSLMTSQASNRQLYPGYQYRVVPTEDNPNQKLTCVVSFAPVYKTNDNAVTRATYTQEQVDADVDNKLEENNNVEITFTPNMAKAMTKYHVYKAQQNAEAGDLYKEVEASLIALDANGFLNPSFKDVITDGVSMEYVPELYTAYNDNTYGCYKQSVSDAYVELGVKNIVAADYTNDENGTRYIHAAIALSSVINNVDKDSRYLVRVWRQVGNGEKVLLNGHEEAWHTNYADLALMGMGEDKYGKTPSKIFTLYDTFEAMTSKPSAAPSLMANGETVNIENVKYFATLYVKDDTSGKYYVKTDEIIPETSIPTGISTIAGSAQVESVRYYNTIGVESSEPFKGVNIVVTRYSDGNTITSKMIR